MRAEYAPRATADLAKIGRRSRKIFGAAVAAALGMYIRPTLARIAGLTDKGERMRERPGVRVVHLVRYPFKIFYTISKDAIMILHIRHTSRRAWSGEDDE